MKIVHFTRPMSSDKDNSVTVSVVKTKKPIMPAKPISVNEMKNMMTGKKK